MFFLHFLHEKIPPEDHVMHAFVDHMIPKLLEQYADTSAKGGDHSQNKELNKETRQIFESKSDQSMVSHLLNGIFPTMRLLNILETERIVSKTFSAVERSVYVLSYLMHDVDKIMYHDARWQEKDRSLATGTREGIEHAKSVIGSYLQLLAVEDFFPEYAFYLEDITYLAVNTQRKWQTHLHTFLWQFRLSEKRIWLLRDLCTYSDLIAYLIPSPSAILLSTETTKLTTILARLSNDELIFSYHQFREVRGLLTSVIQSSLVHLFTHERQGIWSYLFFSDGVVYLKRKSLSFSLTIKEVAETVQAQLRLICAQTIKTQAPGLKFSIQGIVKYPDYYYEFLSLEEYVDLLLRFTIERTKNDITVIPLEKLRQMQNKGEIASELPLDFQTDRRTSVLSRFYSVLFTTMLGKLGKQYQTQRQFVMQELVKQLGLSSYWDAAQGIPNKGGVEYRWFWLAACYLRDHQGLELYGKGQSLESLLRSVLDVVVQQLGDILQKQMPHRYLQHLEQWLGSVVELPLAMWDGGGLPDFGAELERYVKAKGKSRQLLCTLCHSAYPTEEQAENAVLFQPWVYKNKLLLYAGKNAGGICTICALEVMLRQILLKGQLRLTGSKFEALQTKYLTIYPNFFFTHETGALVQGILDQLRDINFFTIRRQLAGREITVADVLAFDAFASSEQKVSTLKAFIHQEEDENEDGEDEEESRDEEVETTALNVSYERSYHKFLPAEYPGMIMFGMPSGKSNDTSTWAMPAYLALSLPLVLSCKVVISEMSLPLFASGHDFPETVVFDAPHPYLDRLLNGKRVRVNQLIERLRLLTSVYRINIDTYARQGQPEWQHLSAIVRDLSTDPVSVFRYLRKQQRTESMFAGDATLYWHIYEAVLKNRGLEAGMSKIERCVNNYLSFYRGGYKSHSILKPVDIVAKAIINSPLTIEEADLLWQIQGRLKKWLDTVRNRQASGYAVFWGKDIDEKEAPAVAHFVESFYQEVFLDYCQGERGVLRSRINTFKDGCEAYYIHQRTEKRFQEQEQETD